MPFFLRIQYLSHNLGFLEEEEDKGDRQRGQCTRGSRWQNTGERRKVMHNKEAMLMAKVRKRPTPLLIELMATHARKTEGGAWRGRDSDRDACQERDNNETD